MDLAVGVYGLTASYPRDEVYGLSQQTKRSAISIPSNIAEGAARRSSKEFIQFLHIALGSAAELETQLLLAERMGFLSNIAPIDQLHQIRRMLVALIHSIEGKSVTRHPSPVTIS